MACLTSVILARCTGNSKHFKGGRVSCSSGQSSQAWGCPCQAGLWAEGPHPGIKLNAPRPLHKCMHACMHACLHALVCMSLGCAYMTCMVYSNQSIQAGPAKPGNPEPVQPGLKDHLLHCYHIHITCEQSWVISFIHGFKFASACVYRQLLYIQTGSNLMRTRVTAARGPAANPRATWTRSWPMP